MPTESPSEPRWGQDFQEQYAPRLLERQYTILIDSMDVNSTVHTDTSAARFPRACHRIRRASRPDTKAAVTAMSADACPSEVTLRRSGGPFTDAETRPEVRGDP